MSVVTICWSTEQTLSLRRNDCLSQLFTSIPNLEVQRVHLAAVDYATGALDMSWSPSAQPSLNSPYYFGVWTLLVDPQQRLWAGGVFREVDTPDGTKYVRNKLAVFPLVQPGANPTVSFTTTSCKVAAPCTMNAWPAPSPPDTTTITGYAWTFGDGTPGATDPQVQHIYTAAGTYPVTVTVTDSNGNTGLAKSAITVS